MIKRKKKSPEIIEQEKENIIKRNVMFSYVWGERPHICAVSKETLKNPINSMYFHHILPKSKYKEAEFDKENIVLLHPDVHASVEMDMYKYDVINKLRETLKTKYNIL